MENSGGVTPVKVCPYGDEFGVTTPSGGLIFNPFHREFLSRVGQVNFSPGIFAYNPSPISKSGSRRNTPSRTNAPFILSPDMQGELFPADIDENPILQLKLQEKLDTQCDDEIQNRIHSFFKSHLIAPSPDTLSDTPSKSTPLGKKKKNSYKLEDDGKDMCEVAVQTAISMPPSFDFESIMRNALEENHSTNNLCIDKSLVKLTRILNNSNEVIEHDKSHSHLKSAPITSNISLSACSVHRPLNSNTNNSSTLYRKNSRHWLSRRSLFSDSSEMNDELIYEVTNGDNESNEQHNTLTSFDNIDNCRSHSNSSSIQPACSTYLSSTQMDISHVKFSIDKFCPNETNCSLVKETAALQMCLPVNWADNPNNDSSDNDDDDDDNDDSDDVTGDNEGNLSNATDQDNSVSMHTLNRTAIERTNKNIYTSYDDAIDNDCNNYKSKHLCIDYCSSQMNSPQHFQQQGEHERQLHVRCGSTSPDVRYNDISFHSPDLSPILPARLMDEVYSCTSLDKRTPLAIQTNVHMEKNSDNHAIMPAKCLFPTSLNKSNS
ncbi:unnamed protein product [Heterobilharzia americana]|nr:unnamed protein product [Heterobilharzia americana]